MKHLRSYKIYESSISEDDILENFSYISDLLGKPEINKTKYGNSFMWNISWTTGINPVYKQDAKKLIDKLKLICNELDDIISASERLQDYNFNMSFGRELNLELIPKEFGEENFKFITDVGRGFTVSKSEIKRFFASKGSTVGQFDLDSSYNEYSESNDLDIYLSEPNIDATAEFRDLIANEIDERDIGRDFDIYYTPNAVSIKSLEEKSLINLSN